MPAAVTLAQAALESDWGRAHMGDANNYFGIKAYDKGGVPQIGPIAKGFITLPTREVVNGRSITVNARFRAYESMADSFRDHANFLKVNSRYAPAFDHTDEPDAFARAIAKAGYATDPSYADKLIALMRQYKLYAYGRKRRATRDDDDGEHDAPDAPEPPDSPARTRRRGQVAALQGSLNEHLRRLGAPRLLEADGRWGPQTEAVFDDVCRVLGVAAERGPRTYRIIAGAAATRTPDELARAEADGAGFAAELRRRYARERAGATVRLGGTPLDEAARRRAQIAALQGDLNGHLERLRQPTRLAVDGEWDPYTERAFEAVCRVLGIEAERDARTFRIVAGALGRAHAGRAGARPGGRRGLRAPPARRRRAAARRAGRALRAGGRAPRGRDPLPAAGPQPAPGQARLPRRARARRPVGRAHRDQVPPGLPDPRARAGARRADLPPDRRRARRGQRRGARPRRPRGRGLRRGAAQAVRAHAAAGGRGAAAARAAGRGRRRRRARAQAAEGRARACAAAGVQPPLRGLARPQADRRRRQGRPGDAQGRARGAPRDARTRRSARRCASATRRPTPPRSCAATRRRASAGCSR